MHQRILFLTLSCSLCCFFTLESLVYAEEDRGDGICQGSAYTAYPPFVVNQSKPNVMFMLDNSGSMKGAIYGNTYNAEAFGFFKNTTYKYDPTIPVDIGAFSNKTDGYDAVIRTGIQGAFIQADCSVGVGKNCWDGSLLNWLTTRRIDSAREVLVGGKVESEDGYPYLENSTLKPSKATYYKIVGNNEPSDRVLSKSINKNNSSTPFAPNTKISIYSPAMNGAEKPSYDPYAKISTTALTDGARKLIVNDGGRIIGEFGAITNITQAKRIYFINRDDYDNPRIVLGPMQRSSRVVMRVADIDEDEGFSIIPNFNWENKNKDPKPTDTFYMVLEDGKHSVDGHTIIAGAKDVDWPDYVSYKNANFSQAPAVFSTVASNNDHNAVVSRVYNPTTDGFNIALLEQENPSSNGHAEEEVNYIALEDGLISTGAGYTLKVEWFPVNQSYQNFDLGNVNHKLPDIIAGATQTNYEADPFALRYSDLKKTEVKLSLEEETSGDKETTHTTEMAAYIFAIEGEVTEYNIALLQEDKPYGLFTEFEDSVRQGASFYKFNFGTDSIYDGSSRDGGTSIIAIPINPFIKNAREFRYVETPIGSSVAALSDAVQHAPLVWGTTPLAENFYEVIRYFTQEEPYYYDKYSSNILDKPSHKIRVCDVDGESCTNSEWDPYYFSDLDGYVSCAQSNVIILTDGAPAKDANVPPFNDEGFDDRKFPANTTIQATPYNGTSYTNDYDGNNSSEELFSNRSNENGKDNLDDIALWANKNRKGGTQDALDTRDLRDDLPGVQALRTYSVGFGSDSSKDLLEHTSTLGAEGTFTAEDGKALSEALQKVIISILNRASSGSGVGTASESRSSSGFLLTQSTFEPSKDFGNNTKVDWAGSLHSYWYYNRGNASYIKEDNVDKGYLNLMKDHIVEFNMSDSGVLTIPYFEADSKGEKIPNANPPSYGSIDEVAKVWDAGLQLLKRKETANPSTVNPPSMDVARRIIYAVAEDGSLKELIERNKESFIFSQSGYDPCLGDNPSSRTSNLISYIRGVTDDFSKTGGGLCRSRATVPSGEDDPAVSEEIWKLGDMTYSTAKAINYGDQTLIFLGTNDGMFHAFNGGYFNKKNLGDKDRIQQLVNEKGDFQGEYLGKELWAFIPKNSMPYLQYLADPDMQHFYGVDGTPYFYQIKGKGQEKDKLIVIMGMRFGGASATKPAVGKIVTPDGGDFGLSSYFALDISDPFKPKYLWEFSHPELGLSYSGPAIITRKEGSHVMFLSGPTNIDGTSSQAFKIFILSVDEDFETDTEQVIVKSTQGSMPDSFGGRLYNNGLDVDDDGYTDVVVYGVASGAGNSATGELRAIATTDDDPENWEERSLLKTTNPIVSSVAGAPCFDDDFVYFGTGRWFFPGDSVGRVNGKDLNALYGVSMKACTDALTDKDARTTCFDDFDIDTVHDAGTVCDRPDDVGDANYAWKISANHLLPRDTYSTGKCATEDDPQCIQYCDDNPQDQNCIEYSKERSITDPTASDVNVVFFTTTQPTANVCSQGGRTRLWALNCMTGGAISESCEGGAGGDYTIDKELVFNLLLPLTGGDINQLIQDFFTSGNLSTGWFTGLPSEDGPTLLPTDSSDLEGELMLWLER